MRKNKRKAFLTPNQNSFAFIICKNHPESRLETLILRQTCDDNHSLKHMSSREADQGI